MKQLTTWTIEQSLMHYDRVNKRLWIVIIMLIVALIGTNAGWLYYESQYTDTEITQEVETGEGGATVIGIGDNYGESEANH